MQRQMAKIYYQGTWRVIYDDQKKNPYTIKYECYTNGHHHIRKVAEFPDFQSTMLYFFNKFNV